MSEAVRARARLRYDPETGDLTWRIGTSAGPASSAAGWRDEQGYLWVRFEKRLHAGQRLIWLIVTGEWPVGLVDHRDTNPRNNRWTNLRDVTPRVNMENRQRPNKNNRAGLLGVATKPGNRFAAKIESRGRVKCLGTFGTAEEAHQAYLRAKREIHPEAFQ